MFHSTTPALFGRPAGIVEDCPDFKSRISANHIDRILSDLKRHEHAEDEVLQDFFLNDHGSGD